MEATRLRSIRLWALVARQHGAVSRLQLLSLGFSGRAIQHRIDKGKLHPVFRGVYAVGRPDLTLFGWWMAAVLSCGEGAVLSDRSAGTLWGLLRAGAAGPVWPADVALRFSSVARLPGPIEVTVPPGRYRRRRGLVVHRRRLSHDEITVQHGIPVTTPTRTILDLAAKLDPNRLEAAINDADRLDLVDPETLRATAAQLDGRAGIAALRAIIDRRTFTLTDSALEREFLPIAHAAGLSTPETQQWVNGFRVDFYWPELGLVVETDGLRYHRTPAQQARDRLRDQAHTAAGLTPLRFTHAQVHYEPAYVRKVLAETARVLRNGLQH